MLALTYFVCFLIAAIVLYIVVVRPLFLEESSKYYQTSVEGNTFEESSSLLEAIAELETDYEMGKLSKEDFDAISLEYKRAYLERKEK